MSSSCLARRPTRLCTPINCIIQIHALNVKCFRKIIQIESLSFKMGQCVTINSQANAVHTRWVGFRALLCRCCYMLFTSWRHLRANSFPLRCLLLCFFIRNVQFPSPVYFVFLHLLSPSSIPILSCLYLAIIPRFLLSPCSCPTPQVCRRPSRWTTLCLTAGSPSRFRSRLTTCWVSGLWAPSTGTRAAACSPTR